MTCQVKLSARLVAILPNVTFVTIVDATTIHKSFIRIIAWTFTDRTSFGVSVGLRTIESFETHSFYPSTNLVDAISFLWIIYNF